MALWSLGFIAQLLHLFLLQVRLSIDGHNYPTLTGFLYRCFAPDQFFEVVGNGLHKALELHLPYPSVSGPLSEPAKRVLSDAGYIQLEQFSKLTKNLAFEL